MNHRRYTPLLPCRVVQARRALHIAFAGLPATLNVTQGRVGGFFLR